MSLDKLKRVVWRLRENKQPELELSHLREAIMQEIGTDDRTINWAIMKLLELKMIEVRVSIKDQVMD